MEPMVGVEPTTYALRERCSTTELHRLFGLSKKVIFKKVIFRFFGPEKVVSRFFGPFKKRLYKGCINQVLPYFTPFLTFFKSLFLLPFLLFYFYLDNGLRIRCSTT